MKALVIHPFHDSFKKNHDAMSGLNEAISLTVALNIEASGHCLHVRRMSPSHYFGKGQCEKVSWWLEAGGQSLVIVNTTLTPIQHRQLERRWSVKILDRNALILEIFGARAKTKEGKLQVSLAALRYQRSRLVRSWTHLERQRGGSGFMGGPGERQIESDRRIIDKQIARLKKEIAKIAQRRALQRRGRQHYKSAVLVGYTNAGKSTLFNHLTSSDVFVKDQLFATLDPTTRLMHLPCGLKITLSDTVGFISNLPHSLIAAFHATLEEVTHADLILHVRNVASLHHESEAQDVYEVLTQLGVKKHTRIVEIFNKADKVHLPCAFNGLAVSALTGEGCARLAQAMSAHLLSGV